MSDDARVAELRRLFPVVEHWTCLKRSQPHVGIALVLRARQESCARSERGEDNGRP